VQVKAFSRLSFCTFYTHLFSPCRHSEPHLAFVSHPPLGDFLPDALGHRLGPQIGGVRSVLGGIAEPLFSCARIHFEQPFNDPPRLSRTGRCVSPFPRFPSTRVFFNTFPAEGWTGNPLSLTALVVRRCPPTFSEAAHLARFIALSLFCFFFFLCAWSISSTYKVSCGFPVAVFHHHGAVLVCLTSRPSRSFPRRSLFFSLREAGLVCVYVVDVVSPFVCLVFPDSTLSLIHHYVPICRRASCLLAGAVSRRARAACLSSLLSVPRPLLHMQ